MTSTETADTVGTDVPPERRGTRRWPALVIAFVVGALLASAVFVWQPWAAPKPPFDFESVAFTVSFEPNYRVPGRTAESPALSLGVTVSWDKPLTAVGDGQRFEFYAIEKTTGRILTVERAAATPGPGMGAVDDQRVALGRGPATDLAADRWPWLNALHTVETPDYQSFLDPGLGVALDPSEASAVTFAGSWHDEPVEDEDGEYEAAIRHPDPKDILVAVIWTDENTPLAARRLHG